ncbi:hypothetical protein CcrMagneto_gp297 [Caulobacter virus Magneto]|uniref:hypothetical protein n=1 Tax=Caulobacter virus Magneto TaxID=1211642 RepID=UPI00028ABC21|nr:hypothetical protein CcrMagneto_gp297 [Caulobacter virus Magneto]AFU87467.1 hypothetical protein CcrMagneto_gp297 [Caulobacter virus Magneto]
MDRLKIKLFAKGVRTSSEALLDAIEALPEGPEKDAVVAAEKQLHARLNWGAAKAGEFFGDESISRLATQRTGGEDKPDAPEVPPGG